MANETKKLSSKEDDLLTLISQALRGRREEAGFTVRELARRSGISASMISDVERGMKSPTISTLAALAEALELPLSSLIESQARVRMCVVRASERQWLVEAGTGSRRERLAPTVLGSKVEILRYVVPPHQSAGPFPPHAPGTIEHLYLVSGRVRVTLGRETADLEAGDCCSCFADEPHGFDNRGGRISAEIMIVVEPPRVSEPSARRGRSGYERAA
jgi:transcriptional regulator with XRE-family HTH domain